MKETRHASTANREKETCSVRKKKKKKKMLRCCSPPVSPWAWKSIVLGSLHIFRSVLAKDSGWRGPQSLTRCMTTKLKYQISLTLRLFNRSAFFASKGHQRQWKRKKRTAGQKKKKKGKTFYKTLFSVPGKQAEERRQSRIFNSDNSHFSGNRANPLNHRSPSKWNGYFVFWMARD